MDSVDECVARLSAENQRLRCRLAALEGEEGTLDSAAHAWWGPQDLGWHSLLANTPLPVMVLDRERCIRYVNRPEFEAGAGPLLGRRFGDLFPPEYRDEAGVRIDAVFRSARSAVLEMPIDDCSGRREWYRFHLGPVARGAVVVAVSAVVINITAHKLANQALHQSESRLQDLFRQSPVGVMLTSDGRALDDFNPAFAAFLGYTDNELRAKDAAGIYHPDDRDAGAGSLARMRTSSVRSERYQQRYVHKNGSVLWAEVNSILVSDGEGKPDYCVNLVLDVTDHRRAEAELAQQRAVLQATIECLPFDFFAIGEDGIYMLENAACREHWGRLVGGWPAQQAPTPEVRELWLENNRRAFAGQRVEEEAVVRIDGDERYIRNILTPIRDGQRSYGILGVNIDLTELKRVERALRRAHDELEEKVRQRTAELEEANRLLAHEHRTLRHMLESSDHERQLIAYEIHDGLAQYLSAASMQLDIVWQLRASDAQAADEAFARGVAMVNESLAEARRLISGVRPPILDESGVVEAVSDLIRDTQARHASPVIGFAGDAQFGRMAPLLENAVYRIVQEALANACQHSRAAQVLVRLSQQGDSVRIAVEDNGVGFDAQSVTRGRFGLEGIRQRVRLLGGAVAIESVPGAGTRITAELPAVHV